MFPFRTRLPYHRGVPGRRPACRTHRLAHYLILGAVCGLLTLPNLGAHSLWDMDEGVNAECTREMLEAGTWVVPTFNWELRTAKPVMTYWLQRLLVPGVRGERVVGPAAVGAAGPGVGAADV